MVVDLLLEGFLRGGVADILEGLFRGGVVEILEGFLRGSVVEILEGFLGYSVILGDSLGIASSTESSFLAYTGTQGRTWAAITRCLGRLWLYIAN